MQVVQLIEEQLSRVDQPVHALLLVGGFAGSEYLKQRVTVRILLCYGAPLSHTTPSFCRTNSRLGFESLPARLMLTPQHCEVLLLMVWLGALSSLVSSRHGRTS